MTIDSNPSPKNPVLIEANRLAEAGLSPIPIKADGSKAAAMEWKPFQEHIATPNELEDLFSGNGCGIGIVAGEVSGGLVVIDIDDASLVEPWQERARERRLLERLAMVKTPRGAHFYLRCKDKVKGSQKLARKVGKNGKPKITIEIRAEGNYIIVPGSAAGCHPSGKLYEQQTGDLAKLSPRLTREQSITKWMSCERFSIGAVSELGCARTSLTTSTLSVSLKLAIPRKRSVYSPMMS